MSTVIDSVDLAYYIDLLKALVARGANVKSVSVSQFNPIRPFDELPLDNVFDSLAKTQLPEYHVLTIIEHTNPSGLVTYLERYHFWKVAGNNGIKTWINLEGQIETYVVKSFGITDALGRFVRRLRKRKD